MTLDYDRLARAIAEHLREDLIPDDVLDTAGAAALLLISETSVLRLATRGRLPAKKLGGLWRFRRSILLKFLSDGAHLEEEA